MYPSSTKLRFRHFWQEELPASVFRAQEEVEGCMLESLSWSRQGKTFGN